MSQIITKSKKIFLQIKNNSILNEIHYKSNTKRTLYNERCRNYSTIKELNRRSQPNVLKWFLPPPRNNTNIEIKKKKYKKDTIIEFSILNKTDGKLYEPAKDLNLKKEADKMNTIKVTEIITNEKNIDLNNIMKEKITLFLISFKNFGFNMLPSWQDTILSKLKENTYTYNKFQIINLSIVEDWYLKPLGSLISNGIIKKQKKYDSRLNKNFIYWGNCTNFRTEMSLVNSFTCYAFLVDPSNRIRWRSTGRASKEEITLALQFIKDLNKEDLNKK